MEMERRIVIKRFRKRKDIGKKKNKILFFLTSTSAYHAQHVLSANKLAVTYLLYMLL